MFTVGAAVLGCRPSRKALIFQIMIWRVRAFLIAEKHSCGFLQSTYENCIGQVDQSLTRIDFVIQRNLDTAHDIGVRNPSVKFMQL